MDLNFTKQFKYALKDSFDFINEISKIKLKKENFIISIDVVSLFTNVPIDETMDIIKKTFFKEKEIIIPSTQKNYTRNNIRLGTSQYDGLLDGIQWEHLDFMLRKCLQESIFMFDKQLYKQIDGVSMGSPLGPIIANIFMNDFELKHMENLKSLGVKFWRRYVDDTFVSF